MVRYNTALVIYLQYDTVQYTTAYRPYSSYDYTSVILAAAGLTPLPAELRYTQPYSKNQSLSRKKEHLLGGASQILW